MPNKRPQQSRKRKSADADSVPPPDVLVFGDVEIDADYRAELYEEFPQLTAAQIVATWQGKNPDFPGEQEYFASESGSESGSDDEGSSSGESGSSASGSGSYSESSGSQSFDD